MILKIANYNTNEVKLACDRFKFATGQGTHEFLVWIGFHQFTDDVKAAFPITFEICEGMPADIKMKAMLGPHWRALLKASLIRDAK